MRRPHERLPGAGQAVRLAHGARHRGTALPLWGALGGDNFYGPLPVEMGVFTDAGAAWDRSGRLKLSGTDANLVRSVGAPLPRERAWLRRRGDRLRAPAGQAKAGLALAIQFHAGLLIG